MYKLYTFKYKTQIYDKNIATLITSQQLFVLLYKMILLVVFNQDVKPNKVGDQSTCDIPDYYRPTNKLRPWPMKVCLNE